MKWLVVDQLVRVMGDMEQNGPSRMNRKRVELSRVGHKKRKLCACLVFRWIFVNIQIDFGVNCDKWMTTAAALLLLLLHA